MRCPQTVDLSSYPDLLVIYLGMPVNNLGGLLHLIRTRRLIRKITQSPPEGLLHHENIIYSLYPLHMGMRQYWRDFDALETFARKTSEHLACWKDFSKKYQGAGFWHESYSMRGGMECVFNDIEGKIGLTAFAPVVEARANLRMARNRLKSMHDLVTGNAAASSDTE